ncbi:DNA internalization-related competence protein ComEC/Rec2 [Paenibacillus allorhizosphaerae]|uniref:ComE operon protein 3 n=1 Tax=Paenibacillus allorhizosphaerae TaxID=2849866 RepID=A0ABM8VFE5_9BACL|nr:DNA internalization-related competence protein ComEC/Rec2 [Paenibacillus allorhizosphaerae]CAG7634788.1 ComE operon protein 3 [Paenibacillus allorhizosphaerae]
MNERPIVGIAVCWILGYMLALVWQAEVLNLYLSMGAGLACCMVLMYKPRGKSVIAALLIVAAAAGIFGHYDGRNKTALPLPADAEPEVRVRGTIVSTVEVDGDRVSFQIEAEAIGGEDGAGAKTDAVPGDTVDRDDAEAAAESGSQGMEESPGTERVGVGRAADASSNNMLVPSKKERLIVSVRLLKKTEQDTAKEWQRGDRIELSGTIKQPSVARNFGGFDYRKYLYYKHIHWQLTVKGLGSVNVTPPDKWGTWLPLHWNDRFRGLLADKVELLFPPEQNGFMKGMLIGLTDEIDPLQFDRFSRLGLTHIIAISGLNVAIFLACILWVLRKLGMTRESYLMTAIALVPLYIMVTGASPSIVRAGIMAMIALYAAYRNRMKDGMNIAFIAGLGMLIWDPYYLVDVSFQLSYLVTLGIMLGVPQMNKMLPMSQKKLRDALSITVVAQLISFPISIYYFNQFSLLSLAANFIIVPVFSTFVMPVGTVAMLSALLYPTMGVWIGWAVVKVNALLFAVVEWFSRLDAFQTLWPTPSPVWILSYYGLLAMIGWCVHIARERREQETVASAAVPMLYTDREARWQSRLSAMNRSLLLPVSVCGFIVLLWFGYSLESGKAEGRVQFLDVGQGDSILIRTLGRGHTILVDGGGTVTFRKPGEEWKQRQEPYEVGKKLLVPLLKKRGVQTIDEIVLTHQDADHYGGLQAVLEQIPVRRLLFNGTLNPGAAVEALFQTALNKGTELVRVNAGDKLEAGEQTVLHFLSPLADEGSNDIRLEKKQNPSSVVFLMEMAGTRWLFTGDMDQAAERRVIAAWSELERRTGVGSGIGPVDVVKIAHHGSKTSTSLEWLAAWQPKHAVISVGVNNIYRHPSPQVIDRLTASSISVHRTDRHGEVQMVAKEGRIRMRTKLEDAAAK